MSAGKYNKDSNNVVVGNWGEDEACNWLREKGFSVKLLRDGNSQFMAFEHGDSALHPDIIVYSRKSKVEILMYIEVKTLQETTILRKKFFYKSPETIPENEQAFWITRDQFESYIKFKSYMKKKIEIIFMVYKHPNFRFHAEIDYLKGKLFEIPGDNDKYYWLTSDLTSY